LLTWRFKRLSGKAQKKFKADAYFFIREGLNFLQQRSQKELFNSQVGPGLQRRDRPGFPPGSLLSLCGDLDYTNAFTGKQPHCQPVLF
jgi:hypothetical protein